tara:strand:+ start:4583 stop:4996 length:414 start_codon:yes stop_codon:yes gene_type:complete
MPAFNEPRNYDMDGTDTVAGVGYLLTFDSTNNRLKLSEVGVIATHVSADESSRDSAGALETTGATVSAYPMGAVLMVAATTGQTWTTGATVYATNAGLATTASGSSAKKIGLYVGEGVTTTANGDLIPVATHGAEIA